MDVGAWLRGLGLGQYEQAFRDNDVDAGLLPTLTADDLRELGRRLARPPQAAAGRHRRPAGRAAAPAAPAQRRRPRRHRPPAAPQAERRQLTVMFVDLVGSTALSARLDPEEMREVLARLPERRRGRGRRASRATSPSTWATACWPTSAGPGRTRTTPSGRSAPGSRSPRPSPSCRRPAGEPLAARVGIATGLVVVGDLLGEGAAREEAVVGETPNLAARLQALADARRGRGRGRHASAARRGCSSSTTWVARPLKGFAEPVRASRVARRAPAEGRFEAHRRGPASLPMVGRDQELALLLERWRQAEAGEGQVVLLVGEAGIGKSRLARALRDAVAAEPRPRVCATSARPTTPTARSGRSSSSSQLARGPRPRTTTPEHGSTSSRRCCGRWAGDVGRGRAADRGPARDRAGRPLPAAGPHARSSGAPAP